MVKFPSHLFPQLFQKGVARSMKLVNLRRHSFSGVILSQCHPTFWEGGRSLQNFQAVMLSFVQKCFLVLFLFFSLLSRGSQMHEYHTELQGISGPPVKAKSCTGSAPAPGWYTHFSGVTHTCENCCSWWEAAHPHVIIIYPLIESKLYRADRYIWYLDISGSPALRFFSESSDPMSPQL